MSLRQSCFAAMYEPVTRRYDQYLASRRATLLQQAVGQVVEIGPGCGANLCHFPADICWTGVEMNPAMRKRLAKRVVTAPFPTQIVAGSAELLPIDNESVDSVVSTLVLCSVRSVEQALQEITRVLRPGGRLFFLEHIAAPHGTWACRTQHLLRSPWSLFADGCQLTRELDQDLESIGFSSLELEHWQAPYPPVPFFLSPHIMGTATK